MNIFVLSFTISLIIMGILAGNRSLLQKNLPLKDQPATHEQVLSESDDDNQQNSKTGVQDEDSQPVPTVVPFPTLVTIVPSPFEQDQKFDISALKYPNSSAVEQSDDTLKLQSTDDPMVINNWYKEKVNNLDFNAVSSSASAANGLYDIRLSASDGKIKIDVSITKDGPNPSIIFVDVEIL